MLFKDNQLTGILSSDLFKQISETGQIEIYKFNALTTILYNCNIDFDTSFTSGSRRTDACVTLTIYVNQNTTSVFTINFI